MSQTFKVMLETDDGLTTVVEQPVSTVKTNSLGEAS